METLNATDAKRELGEVLSKAQSEPSAISKNGKPTAEYAALDALRDAWLKKELQKGIDDLQAGRGSEGTAVIARLRERLVDGAL